MERLPKIISISEKIYRQLLRLYPQSHRHDYAEPMAQLFRDQCRDAWRAKRSAGIFKLWLRVLPDIAKTSIIEQFNERNEIMKMFSSKNASTILTVLGLALGASSLFASSENLLWSLMAASAFVLLAKAIVETFRPSNEWLAIVVRTFVLMFLFAIIMPAQAKVQAQFIAAALNVSLSEVYNHGTIVNPVATFVGLCLFANPVVAAFKLLQFLIQRRKS